MNNALDELNQRRLAAETRLNRVNHSANVTTVHAQAIRAHVDNASWLHAEATTTAAYSVALLRTEDGPALWAFETEHRTAFKRAHNALSADFYTPHGFRQALSNGLQDQSDKRAFHYLIRNGAHLVGGIGLTQIRREEEQSAALDWRISPIYSNRELETHAVQAILDYAFYTHGLQQVHTLVNTSNANAIEALLDNGFQLGPEVEDASFAAIKNGAKMRFEIRMPASHEDR